MAIIVVFLEANQWRRGVTSLNGARPLNSNGAPKKYKIFSVSKKRKKVATFFWFFL